ncbi:uncharacterized protein LOC110870667 [Helianthus annuus]|uniref:uncharacterized protein LOC110870667 n=1 Tax=Helianthus annuus TaxID=4232 RepID=UPI000B8FC5E7|nr:uncharacterized protein LOC110870667 [Helianthus annuus]
MNCISWNIRGLGSANKCSWVKNLKVANEVGFAMIQETQLQSLQGVNVSKLWGTGVFEYEAVDAVGRSGVSGYLKNDGQKISFVNVYSPQKLVDKRAVWEVLKRLITNDDELWCVAGDFNCVRDRSDRRNSKFHEGATKEFNDFLEDMGLHEYSLRGRRFTYLNKWSNAEYRVLDRVESDHCPLLLKIESKNFGAKPFRFYNSWLNRDGLDKVVEDLLSFGPCSSVPDVGLLSKFRSLRNNIKRWHSLQVKLEREEEESLKADILELEMIMEDRDLTEAGLWVLE